MKDDRLYLQHIAEAAERIQTYTADGRDAFFGDSKTQDAVLRNLEIVGEAVKKLSPGIRNSHPDIPWKQIAGMRDILIHHDFGVKLETVWNVVQSHLPALQHTVTALLADEPGDT